MEPDEINKLKIELFNAQIKVRAADLMADEVAVLVRRNIIGSRTPAADALLDYRDPPSTERADRMAALENENERLKAEVRGLSENWLSAEDQVIDQIKENSALKKAVAVLREELGRIQGECPSWCGVLGKGICKTCSVMYNTANLEG